MTNNRKITLHPLTIFRFLWAFAMLFHMLPFDIIARHPASIPVVVLAVLLIIRPQSQGVLLLMAAAQIIEVLILMPQNSNHWVMAALVNVVIVLSAVWQWLRTQSLTDDKWYAIIAPAGRWMLILIYFFAVFHKLNTDFLNPAVSCAVFRYDAIANFYSLPMGGLIDWLVVYGTLIVEAAIPLLLLFRRTRYWGIALGICFHGTLGLDFFFDFGSVMIALMSLFLAPGFSDALVKRHRALFRQGRVLRLIIAGFALGVAFFGLRIHWGIQAGYLVFSVFCWIPYVALVLYLFVTTALHDAPEQPASTLLAPRHALVIGLILVTFINGWLPYFGLKTEYSLEMYSNLRAENNRSNHLLIPASWQYWDYTTDLVYVQRSDVPTLQEIITADDVALPRLEFDRRLLNAPAGTQAQVRYNGEERTVPAGETLGAVDWRLKWLSYDVVELGDMVPCTH